MTGKNSDTSSESAVDLPPVKVIPPLKPGKTITKKRPSKKANAGDQTTQQPSLDDKNDGNYEQRVDIPDNQEAEDDKASQKKRNSKKAAPAHQPTTAPPVHQTSPAPAPQTAAAADLIDSDDDDLLLSGDESDCEHEEVTGIDIKAIKFDEVKETLGRANINDKTLKSYILAYNPFANKVGSLPSERNGKADDVLDRYINEQYEANPKACNLGKMNHLICMIKILFPLVYVSIPNAKAMFKNWKATTNPESATAINFAMARVFEDYMHRMAQPFAVAALLILQAGMLRPCEVLELKREDIRLPGDIVLTGADTSVAGLVINSGKTAKMENRESPSSKMK